MEKLIEAMKAAGWSEQDDGIVHDTGLGPFPTWEAAILACIEVASGV